MNVRHDTVNLRHEADYEIEVADDVYWVPVNKLGKTRYSNDEIRTIFTLSPEDKRSRIESLYEAVQLYQIGNFRGIMDNIYKNEEHILLQYSKSGIAAVRTNEGCCASNSNWLSYLLYGKYEQIGILQYSQRDGNGHVMNYIYHQGWYYFIDMMMYRSDSLIYAGIETGTKTGYKDGELIAGNLFKSRMPISYVHFCVAKHKDTPVLFTLSTKAEICAMGIEKTTDAFNVIHPIGSHLIILYIMKNFPLKVLFKKLPSIPSLWDDSSENIMRTDYMLN